MTNILSKVLFLLVLCVVLCSCGQSSDTEASVSTDSKDNTSATSEADSTQEDKDPSIQENQKSNGEENGEATMSKEGEEISSERLDELLRTQPVYIDSTEYYVQDEQYKALYPDLLVSTVVNNSGTNIKNAVIALAAWDSHGFPVKINGQYEPDATEYVKQGEHSDINLANGESTQSAFALRQDTTNIATFKSIVVSYDDFDGNTWTNPYYTHWTALYDDKVLTEQ